TPITGIFAPIVGLFLYLEIGEGSKEKMIGYLVISVPNADHLSFMNRFRIYCSVFDFCHLPPAFSGE
ncbi:hypothetical protein, partial [Lacticaseibacillus casei]|uniref:hypothetical protein n=1 Tax=Lacticaseibacillus casei TaxID=1582 RepID=UPI001AA02BED